MRWQRRSAAIISRSAGKEWEVQLLMFNSLSGIISGKEGNLLFLENSGIEWELTVSVNSLAKLPHLGEKARVYTYLQHKEDLLHLFGFESIKERDLFLQLIKVNGVGPKQAIRILSGISFSEFVTTLEAGDVNRLTQVPGLGKKGAQKIILALQGKLSLDDDRPSNEKNLPHQDIITGLQDMGFDRKGVENAVKKAVSSLSDQDLGQEDLEKEIFRLAILSLSGS